MNVRSSPGGMQPFCIPSSIGNPSATQNRRPLGLPERDSGKSLLLTFPRVALRTKTGPDKAEDEDFGYSKARTTTQYGPICAATRRAGANFPDFCFPRHWQTPGLRHSSLLELRKIGSQRHPRES